VPTESDLERLAADGAVHGNTGSDARHRWSVRRELGNDPARPAGRVVRGHHEHCHRALADGLRVRCAGPGSPTNATLGGSGIGFGKIFEDDRAVVTPGAASVVEGNSGTTVVNVPVTLSNVSTLTTTAHWTTVFVPGAPSGRADPATDYVPAGGTVTFAPGVTSATVPITVNGDATVEPNEYVVVRFGTVTNGVIGGFWGLGFGVITNDD
jgi:hypothetical protein